MDSFYFVFSQLRFRPAFGLDWKYFGTSFANLIQFLPCSMFPKLQTSYVFYKIIMPGSNLESIVAADDNRRLWPTSLHCVDCKPYDNCYRRHIGHIISAV